MRTSEVLDLSADKIQERGWGTGDKTWGPTRGGGLCLEGGIIAAMGLTIPGLAALAGIQGKSMGYGEFQHCPAYEAVKEYLGDRYVEYDPLRMEKRTCQALWEWNDAPTRTAEEVIEVLRGAAAVERAKEAIVDADNVGESGVEGHATQESLEGVDLHNIEKVDA